MHLLPKRVLRALAKKAQKEPAAAAIALARAKVLREALFELVTRIISRRAPSKSALALFREHWITGIKAHELRFGGGRVLVDLRNDALDFDLIASTVAYRMVQQVLPLPMDRLRICQGPNCSWVFLTARKLVLALVRHGSLRERRQVLSLPRTFATAAKRSTLRKSDMSEKAGASE